MEDILREIGELLLSSIPTIIALLIVWTAYRLIVHTRLQQVLAERHTLTEGAIEQARLARGGIAVYGRREFARRHRCLCDGASVR